MNLKTVLRPLLWTTLSLLIISWDRPDIGSGDTPQITVTVDLSVLDMISNFEIGVTHVHNQWDKGHPEAVARVKSLLGECIRFHNQHITHWGVDNDLMPGPGQYEWKTLDHRMNLIRSIKNSVPVITFCGAPAWMKDFDPKVKWQVEVRVRDENVADFASLCKTVALRYPDVKYFQVWNEFKGYGKDYIRLTNMYKAVYDSVKSERPDVKIGGPYLNKGGRDVSDWDREAVAYWLKNGSGAEFFTYDGWIEGWPPGGKTEEWMMGRTDFFGKLSKEYAAMSNLPVWISEFYGGKNDNLEFTAANYASCYYHALKNGTNVALLWEPFSFGRLFSKTDSANGGQPTPHYFVVKAFNTYFGPGTQLYKAESSSGNLDVLASREKVLLINKSPDPVTVALNRKKLILKGYEVRLEDTPRRKSVKRTKTSE